MTIEEAKKQLETPQWIGEDGQGAVVATSKKEALRKFKELMRQDVGEMEANEIRYEEIGYGWLYLTSSLNEQEKEQNGELAECDWYVSYTKPNDYKVYVYNPL